MKLFDNFKISVLSWLLFHANQKPSKEFYKIKNRILAKYGQHICYDVQFIEGKRCLSCKGTGQYPKYSYERSFYKEICWNCGGTGWYKKPCWNILARIRFGKYESFHQPFVRVFADPQSKSPVINGYIDHEPTKYSSFSLSILFLIYEKRYLKRWYKSAGIGWRSYWWLPRNWINNIVHIIKHGRRSIPFHHQGIIRRKISRLFFPKPKPVFYPELNDEDDLPF